MTESPFQNGGKVSVKSKITTVTFRGEEVSAKRFYYRDEAGHEFSDEKQDAKFVREVMKIYKKRHGGI